jgi:uncharacterized protein with PQ loop repeat
MSRIRVIWIMLFLSFSLAAECQSVNCRNLPKTYSSYDVAINIIKSSKFKYSESVNTTKSSWISGATYLSCDGQFGYLIIIIGVKEYIHADVPLLIWNEFKNADSFGSYYNKNLRGRYRFNLN